MFLPLLLGTCVAVAPISRPLPTEPRKGEPQVAPAPLIGAPSETCAAMGVAAAAAAAAREAAESSRQVAAVVHQLVENRALFDGFEPLVAPSKSPWSYTLSLSALAVGGNANTYSGKLALMVEGNWRDWDAEGHVSGSYAQTDETSTTPKQVNASNAEVTLRGQRNYTPVLGIYLLGGSLFDRVASIAWQAYSELGLSLLWWEHVRGDFLRSRLRSSVGFRATREHRQQYYPQPLVLANAYRSIYGPTVTGNFRFGLSRSAYFFEDAELYQDAAVTNDLRITSSTGITAQINQRVSVSITYKVRYYGVPSTGKKPTDFELAAGINWSS